METIEDMGSVGNGGGIKVANGGAGSPCLTAKTTGRRIHENHGVPPFLIKLYEMVNDESTNSIISWGESCNTFIILDERRLTSEIFPYYFKTNRFDSFISQLNNYGFKKRLDCLEFKHEHFQKGKQHLLKTIKSKHQQSKVINNMSSRCIPTSELVATYAKVKMGQKQMKNKIHRFKVDIEKTLDEVRNNIEDMTQKLRDNYSECIGSKRKFLDIDKSIDFVDIKKEFESIYEQFEVSESNEFDSFMTLSDVLEKMDTRHDGRDDGDGGGNRRRIPQFLHKLYDMVEKQELNHLVSWSLPNHDSFIISDINKFATHVLPMYFCHANFSSFNSQLNIYGFSKVSWERHEYANEWFREGRYDLLANIKRRDKKIQLMTSATTFSPTEVEMFKNQLNTIQQDQENKITWISKYEEEMKVTVNAFKEKVDNLANISNKMILKSNDKAEHPKRVKLDIEENVIGNEKGQDLEVDELRDNHDATEHNNNVDTLCYIEELGIDLEAFDQFIEMEDTIVTREMEHYLSLCLATSNQIDAKFASDNTRCS